MNDDPRIRLAQARAEYLTAVQARDRMEPGEPGYREAVHRVGVAWTAVKRWEREVARQRRLNGG